MQDDADRRPGDRSGGPETTSGPENTGGPETQGKSPPPTQAFAAAGPLGHVVLYQPEIPQNTGNIGRTCVAVGAHLWLVHPMGFRLEEKRIRRAGLDYWQHLHVREVTGWEALQAELPPRPPWVFSRFAKRPLWSASLQRGDVFLFGSESRGLPAELLDPEDPRAVRLPTRAEVRSLNLATTVGIALYELLRQVEARERAD